MDIFDEIISKGKFKEMAIEEMERQEKESGPDADNPKNYQQPNSRTAVYGPGETKTSIAPRTNAGDTPEAANRARKREKIRQNNRRLLDRVRQIGDKVQAEADSGKPRKTQTIEGHQGSGPNRSSSYTRRTGTPGNYKYYYKSEADMKNNLFKSEPSSLIDHGGFEIRIGGGADLSQPVRKGFSGNAREMLEYGLSKGGYGMANAIKGEDMGLKNTHGEQFHTDNDKTVEAHQSNVDVIDTDTEQDKKDRSSTPKRKDSLVDASFKSLSREELFLKAMPMKAGGKVPKGPKDPEQVKEEKQQMKDLGVEKALNSLIDMIPDQQDPNVIATIHENDDSIRQKRKEPELIYRSEMDLQKRAPKGVDPAKHERCVKDVKKQGHDVGSAHAICTSSMKKSELDEIVDLIKGKSKFDYNKDGKLDAHEKDHKEMGEIVAEEKKEEMEEKSYKKKSLNPFIKSAGPGGIIMNFGATTGNPIADNFTAVLNQFAEPVQEQTAKDQAAAYERALGDYVEKGEHKFLEAQGHNSTGGVNHGWAEQMSKPMDQQVLEAFKKGELGTGEENPLLRSIRQSQQNSVHGAKQILNEPPRMAKSAHASIPAANMNTQSFVGGEALKANSPTDAAVMEMYNSMMKSQEVQPGEIVASAGGMGIIAGDPLPPELEQFRAAE